VVQKDKFFLQPPPPPNSNMPLTAPIFPKLADAYCQLIFVGASVTEFCTVRIEKCDDQNTGTVVCNVSNRLTASNWCKTGNFLLIVRLKSCLSQHRVPPKYKVFVGITWRSVPIFTEIGQEFWKVRAEYYLCP